MKKIVVPTDFSEYANRAASVAATLANKTHSSIDLIHSVSIPVDWVRLESSTMATAGQSPSEHQDLYPEVKATINEAKRHIKEMASGTLFEGLKVDTTVNYNLTHKEIVDHADAVRADLIVMGSHGASGLEEMFLGSNAQKVVRFANVPVLVVKQAPEDIHMSNIVFASDFDEAALGAFEKVKDLAMAIDAKIDLLYVNTPYKFESSHTSKVKMKRFFDKCPSGLCSMSIYNHKYEEEGILDFCKEIKADMLAMVTHGRKGISRMLSGSFTEYIINHANIPVLSVRA